MLDYFSAISAIANFSQPPFAHTNKRVVDRALSGLGCKANCYHLWSKLWAVRPLTKMHQVMHIYIYIYIYNKKPGSSCQRESAGAVKSNRNFFFFQLMVNFTAWVGVCACQEVPLVCGMYFCVGRWVPATFFCVMHAVISLVLVAGSALRCCATTSSCKSTLNSQKMCLTFLLDVHSSRPVYLPKRGHYPAGQQHTMPAAHWMTSKKQ